MLIRILRSPELRDDEVTEAILRILYDVLCVNNGGSGSGVDGSVKPIAVRNSELLLADFHNVEVLLELLQGQSCCLFFTIHRERIQLYCCAYRHVYYVT